MSIWFNGYFTITGVEKQMILFQDWVTKYNQTNDGDNEDDDDNFVPAFNDFVPLSGETWDSDKAKNEWGSEWGVAEILEASQSNNSITLTYQSLQTAPSKLFAQLEKKYGVKVEARGAEEEYFPHVAIFHQGESVTMPYDKYYVDTWSYMNDVKTGEIYQFHDYDDWFENTKDCYYEYLNEYHEFLYDQIIKEWTTEKILQLRSGSIKEH